MQQTENIQTDNFKHSDTRPLMVSIQCITYNHEPYIRQCLEGFVIQKTNFRFEAIVHDDASTDGTATIIREYAEKYPDIIKPIYETENQYSKHDGSLRRIMDAACIGKYIAYCEGDDYWTDPNKLQIQVDFLESHPDYSMCFHRAKIIKERPVFTSIKCDSIDNRDYSGEELFKKWIVPTASIVYCQKVKNIQIRHSDKILYGDIFLILKCASLGRIRGMNVFMSVYRVGSGVTYNESMKKYHLMKSPDHFECIKENFSFISSSAINPYIAHYYWLRSAQQDSLYMKMKDLWSAIRYDTRKICSYLISDLTLRMKKQIRNPND